MGSVTISTCVGWIVSPERHVAAQPLSSQPLLHVISHPSALRMNHPVGLTCVSHLAPCKDFRKLRILGNFLLFAERFTCFIFSRLIEMFLESVSNLRAQHTASLNTGSSGPAQRGHPPGCRPRTNQTVYTPTVSISPLLVDSSSTTFRQEF